MSQHYSAEQNASRYPIAPAEWFEQDALHRFNFRTMQRIVGSEPRSRVLDWGCGNLLWSIGLFPGAAITGVETSADALRYATINAEGNGVRFQPVLLPDTYTLDDAAYDAAVAIALIELLSPEQFETIFTAIYRALAPGALLYCTFHNWRPFSALYALTALRSGYATYCKRLGAHISRKSLADVCRDFSHLGYRVEQRGGYNPYPVRLWPLITTDFLYSTPNRLLAYWYCTQYVVLRKPPGETGVGVE